VSASQRVIVAAVGWTGHVFPALALACELRASGHEVLVETFERWRAPIEELGLRFEPAPEQLNVPGISESADAPTLAEAARATGDLLADFGPAAVVSDLWTVAPALAAEVASVPQATLIPHPYPAHEPGLPFYPLGLLPPRTRLGGLAWRALRPAAGTRLPNTRLRHVRRTLDRTRAELDLPPLADYDGQISDRLAMVATFPQLEYPRRWPAHVHVVGPLPFELPDDGGAEPPPGEEPLVLVAPSTERDPERTLIAETLEALADEPVRVLATINRRGEAWSGPLPRNARVVDWLSYATSMPGAAAVVCHGGHGTLTRALAAGVPVLVSPAAGDMAENGARVAWAGAGVMVPQRLSGAASLRLAIRRLLSDPRFRVRAAELADWARSHDGPGTGARLVESLAR
jgi:UDP:flavonoid glycosyltransferase YjiC (YdhE family)